MAAGTWMRVYSHFRGHPKILQLARRLGVSRVQARGHLVTLWTWAWDYATDGDLSDYDPSVIEEAAEWDGPAGVFIAALVEVRLIDEIEGGRMLHDWMDYAGSYREAERKAEQRAGRPRRVAAMSQDRPATQAGPSCGSPVDLRRSEKEEKSENVRGHVSGTPAPSTPPSAPPNARAPATSQLPPREVLDAPQTKAAREAAIRDYNAKHPTAAQARAVGDGADLVLTPAERQPPTERRVRAYAPPHRTHQRRQLVLELRDVVEHVSAQLDLFKARAPPLVCVDPVRERKEEAIR